MILPSPPGYNAPALNRQSNQMLLGKGVGGVSQANTLGNAPLPGMQAGGQLMNKPNPAQIIQALMAKGAFR